MTPRADTESIEEQVLTAGNRDLQQLAAQGLVPLPPERLIPLQVKLTAMEDADVASSAAESLGEVDPRLVAPVLQRGPDVEILGYFATNSDHPLILETIVRLKDVPDSILVELASRIPSDLQEVLILRQDAILREPSILDTLESNPDLNPAVRRRVGEYRAHLLPKGRAELTPPEVGLDEVLAASFEEVTEAIDSAMREPIEGESAGEHDVETGLSEGQIRMLPVPVRLHLSRGAGKTLRDILIRDSNPLVASSVFKFNTFSDGDVERIARMRTVVEDVLEAIGRDPRWVRKYPIALALVRNPRTPIPIAIRLVPRLGVRDLRTLRKDRNVSDAVRTQAQRLFALKVQ